MISEEQCIKPKNDMQLAWFCDKLSNVNVNELRCNGGAEESEHFCQDASPAEVHVLDAGHFALDTKADEVAAQIRGFMKSTNR